MMMMGKKRGMCPFSFLLAIGGLFLLIRHIKHWHIRRGLMDGRVVFKDR